MECNEKFMRQMLSSPYSQTIGAAILEQLESSQPVTIVLADGRKARLENREEALRLLAERFDWQPDMVDS